MLKISPEKVEADKLFQKAMELEKKFFDIADYRGEVDEFQIAKLFNDTDKAGRFRKYITELEDFVKRPDLPSELKESAGGLLDGLKRNMATAERQMDINAFRFKQGPSSPAIERQTAVLNKSRPLQEAIQSPAGFLNSADQFIPAQAMDKFGRPWAELNQKEQSALIRFWTWRKSNPDALPVDESKVWQKLWDGMQ
ncbi:MAG: hypothetical protein ACOH5I_15840 [Oligoflexus sp.]